MATACLRCGTPISNGVLSGLISAARTRCDRCTGFLRDALGAWEQRFSAYLADRVLTPDEEADLRNFQVQLGLSDQDMAPVIPRLFRAKQLSAITYGDIPLVSPGNVLLPRGEVCHYASAASLYQEVVHEHYASRTTSSAFHGSYYGSRDRRHTGAWVQTATTKCTAQGLFLLTNRNMRFIGQSTPRPLPLEMILGFEWYPNALVLQFEGKAVKDFYAVHDAELAAAVLWAARRKLDEVSPPMGV